MEVGEVVADRYEIEDVLGVGGMAAVYRARDRVLGRTVALKFLHERYSDEAEYVERFRREARAIARLSHPNIVSVIDRGEHEGREFIVFEYVAGENLKERVRRTGPLPVDEALRLVYEAARGLAFAHAHGLVHRDVKAQNVLVDERDVAKVTDFGIARSLEVDAALTQTGTVLGTGEYIAPEQAAGERVDARSDQYSLAVVLYELLTGTVPYPGENLVAVAMRHANAPVPSVRERRRDVPPRVDAVIHRALAKRPEERFPSTDEFIRALEACLAEEARRRAPVRRPVEPLGLLDAALAAPSRRRGFTIAALVGGAFLALVIALVAGGGEASQQPDGPAAVEDGAGSGDGVRIRAIRDHDPFGDDKEEHADEVRFATDGNPSTYWTTERYSSFEKPGVGIVLDAGSNVALRALVIASDEPGFRAKIRAGTRPTGRFQDVSAEQTVGERTRFELETDGEEYRYYVVWITDPNGRAHVNEVEAR